jgi:peptidoglycan hydrolase FlgJ
MEATALPFDIGQIANAGRDSDAASAVAGLKGRRDPKAVRHAAEEFEAVFISQMLAPMFETVNTDELFGGGPGADIYRSMMVEEYGKTIARAGGLGIADAVQRELLALQEPKSK